MKKDLQDRAVSNEREYFDERIAKGKIDLTPVINWIRPPFQADHSSDHFGGFSTGKFKTTSRTDYSLRGIIITLIITSTPDNLPIRCPPPDQLPKRLSRPDLRPTMPPPLQRTINVPPSDVFTTFRIRLQLPPPRNLGNPLRSPRKHKIHSRITFSSRPNRSSRNPACKPICFSSNSKSRHRRPKLDRPKHRRDRWEIVCTSRKALSGIFCKTFTKSTRDLCPTDTVEDM